MISRQNNRICGILTLLLTCLSANQISQAQTSAPGLLQPAYMPTAQAMDPQTISQQPQMTHLAQPVQPPYYPKTQVDSPAPNYYSDAQRMVNSRTPRKSDLMAIDQHSLFQYRRMYRSGTTPQPHELAGQWNGVNKGIVQAVGFGQFVKDFQVSPNGQVFGDNIQVSQVKPGQVRLNGWKQKFDYQASDYERIGKFAVQPANGRGFFGRGATLSYADGGNPKGDPAELLQDQVVRLDANHMLGRAVAKFGPLKIPLAYFVLERREEVPQASPQQW